MTRGFPEFILASASPRRRQLLADAGYRFRVVPSPLPEPGPPTEPRGPADLAVETAMFKASAVAAGRPDSIVLGADTIVVAGGKVLGKADTPQQARAMLGGLSGTRHAVITGLAVLLPSPRPGLPRAPSEHAGRPDLTYTDSDITYVTMRSLGQDEIDAYVASGEWRDKAGAYAIQETADAFVERIEGSFSNVVGLPMELLDRMLTRIASRLAGKDGSR